MTPVITMVLFTIALLGIGFAAARATGEGPKEFYLGGRSLGPVAVGLSGSATANTGFVVVGAVGMGYALGLQSFVYALAWLVGDLVFWFLLAKKLVRTTEQNDAVTVIDLLVRDRHKARLFVIFCSLVIICMLSVYSAAQFIAVGKTGSDYFSLDANTVIALSAIGVGTYTMFGGFRSSVWTDILQSVLMILIAGAVLFWLGFLKIGIGQSQSQWADLGTNFLSFSNGSSLGELAALFLGFAFVALGYNLSQPQLTTRIMAARSQQTIDSARWVYIISLQFVWFAMCTIGMLARVYIPGLDDPETALPELATNHMGLIAGAVVIVGMFSAILSSLDSLLLASSSSLAVDVLDNKVGKPIFRLTVILLAGLAALMASFLSSTVFETSLFAATLLSVTIGFGIFVIIMGLGHTTDSLFFSMIVGLVAAAAWQFFSPPVPLLSPPMVGWAFALLANWSFWRLTRVSESAAQD